jgi:hypothetical protein
MSCAAQEFTMPIDHDHKELNLEDFASNCSSIYIDPNNFSINLESTRGEGKLGNELKAARKTTLISNFLKQLDED